LAIFQYQSIHRTTSITTTSITTTSITTTSIANMLFNSVVAVALMAATAVAQTNVTYIDPASIEPQISASWCIGQRAACDTLCSSDAPTNDCNPTTLTYSCLCANGSTPDLALYKNTLPDYICQANFAACIKAHPDDAVGQGKCKTDIQANCGTLDVANFTSTPASTSSSAAVAATTSASPTANVKAASTSAAASATSSAAGVALTAGKQAGAGVLAAGLLAAFGYML
jgi:hypothetical protein